MGKTGFMVRIIGLLMLCGFILRMGPVALAGEEYVFDRMWPTLLQPWYLLQPCGIAVGPDGNIYVADTFNFRVQKFTSSGEFISKLGK